MFERYNGEKVDIRLRIRVLRIFASQMRALARHLNAIWERPISDWS